MLRPALTRLRGRRTVHQSDTLLILSGRSCNARKHTRCFPKNSPPQSGGVQRVSAQGAVCNTLITQTDSSTVERELWCSRGRGFDSSLNETSPAACRCVANWSRTVGGSSLIKTVGRRGEHPAAVPCASATVSSVVKDCRTWQLRC